MGISCCVFVFHAHIGSHALAQYPLQYHIKLVILAMHFLVYTHKFHQRSDLLPLASIFGHSCSFVHGWSLFKMATSQGYQCEFIDSVFDDLYCKKCTLVARRLTVTTCCGESFCKVCIADLKEQGKPCPECGEKDFTTFDQVKNQKRINCLKVYCSMKERGCGWSGTLEQLDTHLDPDQDNCQYVDTKCPLNCQQAIPKIEIEQHVAQNCAKRPYVCQHCNFKAIYEEVVDEHLPECKYVPLQCPNLCGVTFERDFMEDHMKMCRLQEVGCEFSGAGCDCRFIREDKEEHTRQSSQKHLTLTASLAVQTKEQLILTASLAVENKEQLKQKFLEQDKKHKEEVEKQKKKIEELEKKIAEEEKKLKEEVMKLQRQEKKLGEQEKRLGEQEKKLGEQEKKLGEQEKKLGEQEKKLVEQEKKQEKKLGEQEKKLGEQEKKLGEQEKKVLEQEKKQEKKLGEQEKKLGEQEKKLGEQEKRLVEQEKKLGEQEKKLAEQEKKLGEQEKKQEKKLGEQVKKLGEQEKRLVEQEKKQEKKLGEQEKRLVEQEKKQEKKLGEQEKRLVEQEKKQEKKLGEQEKKLGEQEKKLGEQEKKQEKKLGEQEKKLGQQMKWLGEQKQKLDEQKQLSEHLNSKLNKLEQMLKEVVDKSIHNERQLSELPKMTGLNRRFEMRNFSKEKAKDKPGDWMSPAMYTHVCGYKFCIGLDANGSGISRGHGLSVDLWAMPGEYDRHLKWPILIAFTIELFNQKGGKNVYYNCLGSLSKPAQEYSGIDWMTRSTYGCFVANADLNKFLNNDTLFFHVSKIEMI